MGIKWALLTVGAMYALMYTFGVEFEMIDALVITVTIFYTVCLVFNELGE